MTIVIGLLAETRQPPTIADSATATILLCADTMASFVNPSGTPVGAHHAFGKIYELPNDFYAAFCDDYSWSHQIATELYSRLATLDFAASGIRELIKLQVQKSFESAFEWFREEALRNEVGITVDEFLYDQQLDPALRNLASGVIADAAKLVPAELIVAGQTHRGPVLLKGTPEGVQETTEFLVSGGPMESAINWLTLRDQRNSMSVQRSFYHMMEAKVFAELDRSRSVGSNTQVIVIPPPPNPPQPIRGDRGTLLERWARDHYVRPTDDLDRSEMRESFLTGFSLDRF